ncbi:MAG: hypothetical protein HOY79_17590 [Streptomyces sp.]|nr:hypothetical protein [Streptomyces sp.]
MIDETVTAAAELPAAKTRPTRRKTPAVGLSEGPADAEQPKAPASFVGYVVQEAGWAMPRWTRKSGMVVLPEMYGLGDAKAMRDGYQDMAPETPRKVILKATITFEVVEGGDRG